MKDLGKIDVIVWLSLAFVIVLIALIADNMGDSVNQEIENEYAVYQSTLADSSAKTLRLFFIEVESELRLLSRLPEVQNLNIPKAKEEMEHLLSAHNQFITSILLVDSNGKIIIGTEAEKESPELDQQIKSLFSEVVKKRDAAKTHKQLNGTTMSDQIVISGAFNGFGMAVPIVKNNSAKVSGMVVVMISKGNLEKNLLQPIDFRKNSGAFILSHSFRGIVLPKSSEMVLGVLKNMTTNEEGRELLKSIGSGGNHTVWIDAGRDANGRSKGKMLLSFAPAKFANVVWSVGLMTPRDEITKIVQKSRKQSLLLASFVAAILYVGAIVLLKLNRSRVIAHEKGRYATELAEKNKELERLDKMKDEFVSIVTHDLRSPIATISSYAKLMLPTAEKSGVHVKQLNAIIKSSGRLLTLVNDILDIARVEAGEMKLNFSEVEIDSLVKESFKATEFNAQQKNISLTYKASEVPRLVNADNSKLYQVLNNLIGNAIKFTPDNGSVTVEKKAKSGNLLLTVTDTGPGLTTEQTEIIFDKFKQAGEHNGAGLGLAICKNMVELHQGKIWVESEYGKGATFKFTIPLSLKEKVESDESVNS